MSRNSLVDKAGNAALALVVGALVVMVATVLFTVLCYVLKALYEGICYLEIEMQKAWEARKTRKERERRGL